MRVNFEVNTHLVSEICQDNKKLVNIFLQCSAFENILVYMQML